MDALIVEDEVLAAKHLKHVTDEVGGIRIITVLESISETIDWIKTNGQPQLLFLDIHLADGSAFEIFNHVNIDCPIIFTTAYDEYALKAFKVNSIDYLLKPVDVESVRNAIKKLEGLSGKESVQADIQKLIDSLRKTSSYKTHFLIPLKGDKLLPIRTNQIACFYIDASLVRARTFDDKTYTFENTLDELCDMLDPSDFFRANRQFIINRNSIKDIDFWFNSRLSVNLNVIIQEKVIISKARVPEFKLWFQGDKN